MLFTSEYSIKMPIMEALLTSVIGICTVLCILAVIAVLIILVSKVIRGMEKSSYKEGEAAPVAAAASAPQGVPMPNGMMQGELELVKTDEKTAAVIMAIVSDKSGIPLNRLNFKSIKLMED